MNFKNIILFFLLFNLNLLLADEIYIYQDTNSSISLANIINKRFKKLDKPYINKGIIHDTIWLKIITKDSNKSRVILIDNTTIDNIEFYDLSKSFQPQFITGDHHNIKSKDIQDINFAFNISKNSKIYYIKIQTLNSMAFKINIQDKNIYQISSHKKTLFLTFFLGFMLSLLIYNIFIYIIIREKSYLFYVLYHISFITMMLGMSGFGYYYIWQDNIYINEFIFKILDDVTIIFAMLFAKYFLDTKHNFPKIDKVIMIFVVLELFLMAISTTYLHYIFIDLVMYIMLGTVITIFTLNILAIKQNISVAKYYFVGWSIMLIAVLITLLQNFGLIEVNFFTTWALYISAMIEVVIFSIALAKKIELLKQKETNLLEIHHRVKNNLQTVSSFIMLMGIKDNNLKSKLEPLQDKIQTISILHEYLYKHNSVDVDAKEYIQNITSRLVNLYDKNSISIEYNIQKCNLTVSQSTTIGLIVSELVSNAIKYAFDNNKSAQITINLQKTKNITLEVRDNGVGFIKSTIDMNETFGLYIIKKMVEQNGIFSFNSKKGDTLFKIVLEHL